MLPFWISWNISILSLHRACDPFLYFISGFIFLKLCIVCFVISLLRYLAVIFKNSVCVAPRSQSHSSYLNTQDNRKWVVTMIISEKRTNIIKAKYFIEDRNQFCRSSYCPSSLSATLVYKTRQKRNIKTRVLNQVDDEQKENWDAHQQIFQPVEFIPRWNVYVIAHVAGGPRHVIHRLKRTSNAY